MLRKKMNALLFLGLLGIAFAPFAFAGNGNKAVLGDWYNGPKTAKVNIYECGEYLCGKIVWLNKPYEEDGVTPKRDKENPDFKLRSRPVLGLQIMKDFEKVGENKWDEGNIYDPKSGNDYSCKMTLKGDVLEVRGYIGFSLLGRTEEWTRP